MTFPDRHLFPTAITQAMPPEVTVIDHGLETGQRVRAAQFITQPSGDATGMEQLNFRLFQVRVVDDDTFELFDIEGYPIDTRNYTAFVNNGLALFTLTGPDLNVENTA